VNILIVDDHAIILTGLKQIVQHSTHAKQIDTAANAHEAQGLLKAHPYNLVLLDISLPDKNGLQLLKQIRQDFPKLPVLMLSMYPEDQYAVRAIKAGAAGYLTKEYAPEELQKAIDKVLAGGKYISAAVAEQLATVVTSPENLAPHDSLSDREYEVLRLIASGKSVSDIAHDINKSVKTISTYRSRILKKMNMNHNAELTHYVIKEGLLDK